MEDIVRRWLGDSDQNRHYKRWSVHVAAELATFRTIWPCLVLDISLTGAGVRPERVLTLDVGFSVALHFRGYGSVPSQVRHNGGEHVGLFFEGQGRRDADMARWLDLIGIRPR